MGIDREKYLDEIEAELDELEENILQVKTGILKKRSRANNGGRVAGLALINS